MEDVEEVGERGLVCRRKQEKATALEPGNRTRQLLATEIRRGLPGTIPLRAQGNPLEVLLRDSLEFIGVSLLKEWDTLVFLYRHGVVLSSVDQLARLLHYESARLGGVRIYKAMASDDSRQYNFQQVLRLTRDRAGRLMLAKILKLEVTEAVPKVKFVTLALEEVPNDRQ